MTSPLLFPLVPPEDPSLWMRAVPVTNFTSPGLRYLIEGLHLTMAHHRGLGLAAPQVGYSLRVFLFRDGMDGDTHVAINPEVVTALGTASGPEGCLTWPGQWVSKTRASHIRVRFWGPEGGDPYEMDLSWLGARCFLHELDHLNGLCLFPRPASAVLPQS